MSNPRTNARITGFLFILGTVPPIASCLLWGQSLSSPDYLSLMAAQRNHILAVALFALFMGYACAGIGISLYPVLKPHGEGLALGVLGFRVMEGTIQVVSAIGITALLAVSQEFVKAGSTPDSYFRGIAAVVKMVRAWVLNGAFLFPWCIAAFIYYTIFFRTRLVPRWLSGWGILALALMLIGALAGMFGLLGAFSPLQIIMMLPIMVQEMVLAVWLIVKGFNQTALSGGR